MIRTTKSSPTTHNKGYTFWKLKMTAQNVKKCPLSTDLIVKMHNV